MIVVASDTELAVGEYRTGRVSDKNCDWQKASFVVVREVGYDDYIRSAIEYGASEEDARRPFMFHSQMRYYEVATD